MNQDNEIKLFPIGIIHTPHKEKEKTPIQPKYSLGIPGKIEIFPEYTAGLKDLDGFSYIYLLFHFHKSDTKNVKMIVKPFLEDVERGLFSTRAPFRPNPIGQSIVKLVKIEDNFIFIENVDILDGTPLLDIKPYTSKFDLYPDAKSGWQDAIDNETAVIRGKRGYEAH